MANLGFVAVLLVGRMLKSLFLGQLRDGEVLNLQGIAFFLPSFTLPSLTCFFFYFLFFLLVVAFFLHFLCDTVLLSHRSSLLEFS